MNEQAEVVDLLCRSAESFLATHCDLVKQHEILGKPRDVDRHVWSEMAALGWLGLSLREELGGAGMNCWAAASLCNVFGQNLFAEPYISAVLMPGSIFNAVPDGSAVDFIETLVSGKSLFTLAWQEEVAADSGPKIGTTIANGCLSGEKLFVANCESDSILLVLAEREGQPCVVAVDARTAGVSIRKYTTAQGNFCTVVFSEVAIENDQILLFGEVAERAVNEALAWGRIASSAQLAGLAEACLRETIGFVNQRIQFGQPIGMFQSVKHRCVDSHISVELAQASWTHAAKQFSQSAECGKPESFAGLNEEIQKAIYSAKARCSDVARSVSLQAVQLHGAMGFTEECNIGLYLRAALQYSSWLGTPARMRRAFAKGTIQTDFRDE